MDIVGKQKGWKTVRRERSQKLLFISEMLPFGAGINLIVCALLDTFFKQESPLWLGNAPVEKVIVLLSPRRQR